MPPSSTRTPQLANKQTTDDCQATAVDEPHCSQGDTARRPKQKNISYAAVRKKNTYTLSHTHTHIQHEPSIMLHMPNNCKAKKSNSQRQKTSAHLRMGPKLAAVRLHLRGVGRRAVEHTNPVRMLDQVNKLLLTSARPQQTFRPSKQASISNNGKHGQGKAKITRKRDIMTT